MRWAGMVLLALATGCAFEPPGGAEPYDGGVIFVDSGEPPPTFRARHDFAWVKVHSSTCVRVLDNDTLSEEPRIYVRDFPMTTAAGGDIVLPQGRIGCVQYTATRVSSALRYDSFEYQSGFVAPSPTQTASVTLALAPASWADAKTFRAGGRVQLESMRFGANPPPVVVVGVPLAGMPHVPLLEREPDRFVCGVASQVFEGLDLAFARDIDGWPASSAMAWVPLTPGYVASGSPQVDLYAYYDSFQPWRRSRWPSDGPTVWRDAEYSAVYHLDEPAGATLADATGAHPANAGASAPGVGAIGRGRRFDGPSELLMPTLALSSAAGSLSLLLRTPPTAEQGERLVFRCLDGGGQLLRLYFSAGERNLRLLSANGVMPLDIGDPSGEPTSDDNWHQVALTWKAGGAVKLYVDGAERATAFYTGTAFSCADVRFGSGAGADAFIGYLDELRFSNVERSADWIQLESYSWRGDLARLEDVRNGFYE